MLDIDQLLANYATVSENKCGFFLCRRGSADLLLNNKSFHVEAGMMCIYTPYTFIRIVQHSPDIGGCLMEGGLDAIQPALSDIHIADRLHIRSHPCVRLGDAQVARIEELFNTIGNRTALARESCSPRSARLRGMVVQSLLQAFCLEVLDIYFNCAPVEELPQDCEERIFNRFSCRCSATASANAPCHTMPTSKACRQTTSRRSSSRIPTALPCNGLKR